MGEIMKNNGELLIVLPRNKCVIKRSKYLSYVIKDNKCYVYLIYSSKYYLATSLPSSIILDGREASKILRHVLINKTEEELYNAILYYGDTASKKTYRINLTVSSVIAPKLFKLAFIFNVKISTIIRMLLLAYYRSATKIPS